MSIDTDEFLGRLFYEYGGMKKGQNTKSHICDEFGKVLCGVKSNWMEAGEPINNDLFVSGSEHLFPLTDKRHSTCKKCFKEYLQLRNKNL
jgi:hypothetical protein